MIYYMGSGQDEEQTQRLADAWQQGQSLVIPMGQRYGLACLPSGVDVRQITGVWLLKGFQELAQVAKISTCVFRVIKAERQLVIWQLWPSEVFIKRHQLPKNQPIRVALAKSAFLQVVLQKLQNPLYVLWEDQENWQSQDPDEVWWRFNERADAMLHDGYLSGECLPLVDLTEE